VTVLWRLINFDNFIPLVVEALSRNKQFISILLQVKDAAFWANITIKMMIILLNLNFATMSGHLEIFSQFLWKNRNFIFFLTEKKQIFGMIIWILWRHIWIWYLCCLFFLVSSFLGSSRNENPLLSDEYFPWLAFCIKTSWGDVRLKIDHVQLSLSRMKEVFHLEDIWRKESFQWAVFFSENLLAAILIPG